MQTYIHGADIYTAAETSGIDENSIMDFSSNINPLGMPPSVAEAIHGAVAKSWRYPDIKCRQLKKAISTSEGIDPEWIFCANGAAEAIYRIVFSKKPKQALLTAPTFGEYEEALRASDCIVSYHDLHRDQGFALTESILDNINPDIDMVFICNPNNPTGLTVSRQLTESIVRRCALAGATLVVDECFMDFVEGGQMLSMCGLMAEVPQLIVLKAFTKIYAMAGVRLGYCMSSDQELIRSLAAVGPPWNVSVLAQEAGVAAIRETDYPLRTAEYVKKERKYLTEALSHAGMEVYPSQANYIFFHSPDNKNLKGSMLSEGILIRSCGNYHNLGTDYYRIAVRTKEENIRFAEALKKVTGRV